MSYKTDHPEKDPAEGSRETINRELAHQAEKDRAADSSDKRAASDRNAPKPGDQDHRPM